MAAALPMLNDIAQYASGAGLLAFVYGFLVTTLALTAVFSSKPVRRKAAKEVLLLLLPRRGRGRSEEGTK
ncbi:hypothetical protein [Nocardiopsis sp. LOL_012]|uniref:hypothetical protein n=1 Tax=Nocardiopsis sp. LOL_012 TaxID=3345409 RepID=UPI003A845B2E